MAVNHSQSLKSPHKPDAAPKGVLLLNLGTPEGQNEGPSAGPSTAQVRTYLREFLMDPYVVDIPFIARWLLVNVLILPRRPRRAAAAYAKIWTAEGSPLRFYLDGLVARVSERLGSGFRVVGGMRYGSPSIRAALSELARAGIQETRVIPLYPQYSLAATESSIEACRAIAREVAPGMKLEFQPAFHADPKFLDAFAGIARREMKGFGFEVDHTLFSFHGLPERQIKRTDPSGSHCLASANCCVQMTEVNRDCYRAQCYETARQLAARLGLAPDRYTVCFQSRLGRTPWIRPYTDVVYGELTRRGIRRVAVLCPAFVADCLETLEEVAIRGREQFRELGGEELRLISSLNADPDWATAVAELARVPVPGLSVGQAR
jgi:protoporphyrin/coproporphyrin ferrochelatase